MIAARSELFLSVDLVNSTAYKQRVSASRLAPERNDDDEAPWQQQFLEFYYDFPQTLGEIRDGLAAQHVLAWVPEFDLWKPIGDELVFTVTVTHEDTVYSAVRMWLAALSEWDRRLKSRGMGTKGGAFIATFPYPDRDVAISRKPYVKEPSRSAVGANDDICSQARDHATFLYDYFGPSIDTGFRILSQASPRRFTMTVEVAWAFLQAALAHRREGFWAVADVEFMGGRELKGVWGGRDYPLFVVDRRHHDPVNISAKALTDKKLVESHAVELCRACVEDPLWPSAIYLSESGAAGLSDAPVDQLAELATDTPVDGMDNEPKDLGAEPADDRLQRALERQRQRLKQQQLEATTRTEERRAELRRMIARRTAEEAARPPRVRQRPSGNEQPPKT